MKMTLLAVLLLIPALLIAAPDWRGYCGDAWPDDFHMQENCLEAQKKATQAVQHLLKAHNVWNDIIDLNETNIKKPLVAAVANCFRTWKVDAFDVFNMPMVKHCIKNQIDSYNRLHGED